MPVITRIVFSLFLLATVSPAMADAGDTKLPESAERIPYSKNMDLRAFANHGEVVATIENDRTTVKIVEVNKCEGCSNEFAKIYAAISYADLGENLIETYPAARWKFLHVVSSKGDLAFLEGFLVFEAEAWEVQLSNGKSIEYGKFEIGVNLITSYMKRIK